MASMDWHLSRRWWYLGALLFVAFVALAGHETAVWRSTPATSVESSGARVTLDPGGFIETLLPARPDPANRSWVKRSPDSGGHNADMAVLGALVAVFMLRYAIRSRQPCGTPAARRGGRGAVVRGPPVLLSA